MLFSTHPTLYTVQYKDYFKHFVPPLVNVWPEVMEGNGGDGETDEGEGRESEK